jgi:mannose-6-phosphate isomerase-like protein (cupin superfamily)
MAPDGSGIRYLELGAARASLVEVRLPAAGVTRPVRHRTVEEIWHFLEGSGRVWLQEPDGSEHLHEVGPGGSLTIPAGWAFQFAAGAGGPLRFLCYTSPPWPGDEEAEPVSRGGLGDPLL